MTGMIMTAAVAVAFAAPFFFKPRKARTVKVYIDGHARRERVR